MGVPQPHLLTRGAPEWRAENDVNLVHMHKHVVVLMAEAPDELVEAEGVAEFLEEGLENVHQRSDLPRRSTPPQDWTFGSLFAKRMHGNISGQAMLARLEADHMDVLAMFGKFLYPPMKKAQDRMFGIDDLRDDEEFHGLYNLVFAGKVLSSLKRTQLSLRYYVKMHSAVVFEESRSDVF